MITLKLSYQDAKTLLALIGNNVIWAHANPFLMLIGEELRKHQPHETKHGNSGEMPINVDEMRVKQ